MEYFDVLDENRVYLGYQKKRGKTLEDFEYNQSAEIWIVNNNKILLTQRSSEKSHPLMWEVPGGMTLAKETTDKTIIRELNEEININLNKEDIKLVDTHIYKNQFIDIYFSYQNIDISNIKLQEEEVSDFKFVSKDEFLKMINNEKIVPAVITRFNMIKEKINID